MRRCLVLAVLLFLNHANAVTLDVGRLPGPSFADGEVSADAALPAGRTDGLRTFRLELTFGATPSNNVQVAFGRDAIPADGALAAEETDFIVGWYCGEWFLRPQGLRERHAFPSSVTNGTRTLTMEIPVSASGEPRSVAFMDGAGAFAFPRLTLAPVPEWLKPSGLSRAAGHLVLCRGPEFGALICESPRPRRDWLPKVILRRVAGGAH